jgi:hypothetical protein
MLAPQNDQLHRDSHWIVIPGFASSCLCGRVRLLVATRLPRLRSQVCPFRFSSRRYRCARGCGPSPRCGRCARRSQFEPTDAEAKLVTFEGGWLWTITSSWHLSSRFDNQRCTDADFLTSYVVPHLRQLSPNELEYDFRWRLGAYLGGTSSRLQLF